MKETKRCYCCKETKPLSEFFGIKVKWALCKQCNKQKEREKRIREFGENCGHQKVLMYPNRYTDEFQRKCTFDLMQILGYQFNEEKGIWFKEPWKTKDGQFPLIKGVLFDEELNIYFKSEKHRKVVRLRKEGKTIQTIIKLTKYNINSIYRILRMYETD